MHLPRHPERREHRRGHPGCAPVPSRERRGDALARAEAIEHRAPGEAAVAQVGVDAAPEVLGQVGARGARRLVDGEVRGPGERGRDAAQPHATGAVGAQLHHHHARRCPVRHGRRPAPTPRPRVGGHARWRGWTRARGLRPTPLAAARPSARRALPLARCATSASGRRDLCLAGRIVWACRGTARSAQAPDMQGRVRRPRHLSGRAGGRPASPGAGHAGACAFRPRRPSGRAGGGAAVPANEPPEASRQRAGLAR